MMDKRDIPDAGGYVYILGSINETLYVGMTSSLEKRMWEHQSKVVEGSYTSKYNITRLLYFEAFDDLDKALKREIQIKKWSRNKKITLIQKRNFALLDLANDWF